MRAITPEIGDRFGRWTVIDNTQRTGTSNARACLCKCDCGNIRIVSNVDLRHGYSKSCGCLRGIRDMERSKSNSQGHSGTRLYRIWQHMNERCYYSGHPHYKDYGGRGISVCSEWRNDFMAFHDWAVSNGYKSNLSIDRIDNNKGYYPENCRWATDEEQQNNTRWNRNITLGNKTQSMSRWARELNMPVSTIYSRLKAGWDDEKVLTYPVDERKATKRAGRRESICQN